MVADEMFPDGPGNLDFVDVEDGVSQFMCNFDSTDCVSLQVRDGVGGPAGLLSDLTASEKTVHADFYNNFGDLFDDNNLD